MTSGDHDAVTHPLLHKVDSALKRKDERIRQLEAQVAQLEHERALRQHALAFATYENECLRTKLRFAMQARERE